MLELVLKIIGYILLAGGTLFISLTLHLCLGEQKEELIRDFGRDGWMTSVVVNITIFLLLIVGWIVLLNI